MQEKMNDQEVEQYTKSHPSAFVKDTQEWEGAWRGYWRDTQVLVDAPHKWVQRSNGDWTYAGTESTY